MPSVVNLGQFGPQRDSDFAGLADALYKGNVLRETSRTNRANEAINASLAETKAINTKAYSEAVNTQKANLDFKKNEDNRKYAYKTLQDLSRVLNDKSPAEQEALLSSDHGKEINNLVKTYIPEYYDKDKKQIMLLTDGQMNKDAVDAQVNKATSRVASGAGTPQDIQLIKLHSRNPELIASALTYAQEQGRKTKDQSEPSLLQNVGNFIKSFIVKQGENNAATNTPPANALTPALAAPAAPQAAAVVNKTVPTGPASPQNPVASAALSPNGDDNDPLGILKR